MPIVKKDIPKTKVFFSLHFLDFFIIAFKYVEMNILIRRHVQISVEYKFL